MISTKENKFAFGSCVEEFIDDILCPTVKMSPNLKKFEVATFDLTNYTESLELISSWSQLEALDVFINPKVLYNIQVTSKEFTNFTLRLPHINCSTQFKSNKVCL